MSTAENTVEKVLRPPWNFEWDYNGKNGDSPVLFTWPAGPVPSMMGQKPTVVMPDYSVLDQEARLAAPPMGISPMLAKFVPAQLGSTLLLLLPVVPALASQAGASFVYIWRVIFRQRSAADYNRDVNRGLPYSVPKTSLGSVDTRTGVVPGRPNLQIGGPRYIIPASAE